MQPFYFTKQRTMVGRLINSAVMGLLLCWLAVGYLTEREKREREEYLVKRFYKVIAALGILGLLLADNVNYVSAEEYEYDDLDRVTKVIYDDGSYVKYAYDKNGNIVNVDVYNANPEPSDKPEEPDNPKEPESENQPENGSKPGNENQSGNGNQSGSESQPGNGNQAGNESKPGNGNHPGNENQPGNGKQPGNESQPENGNQSGNESKPGNGNQSGNGSQPGNENQSESVNKPDNTDKPDNQDSSEALEEPEKEGIWDKLISWVKNIISKIVEWFQSLFH